MHTMFGGEVLRGPRPAEAEAHLRAALAIDPANVQARGLLGKLLFDIGGEEEGLAHLREAARLAPDNPFTRGAYGSALLLLGRFREGWPEWALSRNLQPRRLPPEREWTGREPLAGRTLLILSGDGFGDTFQFCRFVPLLAREAARTIYMVPVETIPALGRLAGGASLIDRAGPVPAFDLWTDDKILPVMLAVEPGTIPFPAGYLAPDPARVAAFRTRLPPAKRRVGLIWSGDTRNDQNYARSLPPAETARLLAPLLAMPDTVFVSYQLGPRRADLAGLPGVVDLGEHLRDFGDTAAAIAATDLTIGVETAVTHLSCALGHPTWMMLSRRPDWRWQLRGDTSPWYASARLWRQPALDDWTSVTTAIAAALAPLTARQ